MFVRTGSWLRDAYYCLLCRSLPRFRALIHVLNAAFPRWRELAIHESSPAGAASAKLARECAGYVATHLFPDVAPGASKGAFRCEDLEQQTFADGIFDLVVTQDVLEHVVDPARAFAEIARTLKPGGAHVFTLPWHRGKPTLVRARREEGRVVHLHPPEYHRNPIDPAGSLVVTEWGADLAEFIERRSGLRTTVESITDSRQGLLGEFLEVFVSRKPG